MGYRQNSTPNPPGKQPPAPPAVGEAFNPRDPWQAMEGFNIPSSVAGMPNLPAVAKLLYGHLRWRAGLDGLCFPSQRDMAAAIGENRPLLPLADPEESRRQAEREADRQRKIVRRALQDLVQAGLIRLEYRTFESGQKTTNLIVFLWHPSFNQTPEVGDKNVRYPNAKVPDANVPYPVPNRPEGTGQKRPLRTGQKRPVVPDTGVPYVPDKNVPTVSNNKESSSSSNNKEETNQGQNVRTATPPNAPEAEHRVPDSDFPDDDDSLRGPWANPDEELKAIFRHKAGEPIPIFLLDQIRGDLASNGVEMVDFVAEIRKHLKGNWLNPPAFMRSRSKAFRKLTRTGAEPMTAAEAEAKRIAAEEAGYQCPICKNRKRGEGLLFVDGKAVPCACASPQYIQRQIERGVLKATGAAA